MRYDLTAKGRDAVCEIAEEGEPEEEVAFWVEQGFSKLFPLEMWVVNACVVVANHLNCGHFLFLAQKSGAALRCREEDVDDNRPKDSDGCNDEIDPFPRCKTPCMDMAQAVSHDATNNVGQSIVTEPNADSEGLVLARVE